MAHTLVACRQGTARRSSETLHTYGYVSAHRVRGPPYGQDDSQLGVRSHPTLTPLMTLNDVRAPQGAITLTPTFEGIVCDTGTDMKSGYNAESCVDPALVLCVPGLMIALLE